MTEPKLFQQSVEDEVTPYAGAVAIYDLAPAPKDFWPMRGPHGKMIRLEPELYTAHLVSWLEGHLGP